MPETAETPTDNGSTDVEAAILDAIDFHTSPTEYPNAGKIVDVVLRDTNAGLGDVCDALKRLHFRGVVYRPASSTVARTWIDE